MRCVGLSPATSASAILSTTSSPSMTFANGTCLPSSAGLSFEMMKKYQPIVPPSAKRIDTVPRSCFTVFLSPVAEIAGLNEVLRRDTKERDPVIQPGASVTNERARSIGRGLRLKLKLEGTERSFDSRSHCLHLIDGRGLLAKRDLLYFDSFARHTGGACGRE